MAQSNPFAMPGSSGSSLGSGVGGPFALSTNTAGFNYPQGFANWLFNEQPGAGFSAFAQGQGIGNLGNPFGRYLSQNLPTLYNQYTVATTQDPSLNFTDWLNGQMGQFQTGYELDRPNFQRPIAPRRYLG